MTSRDDHRAQLYELLHAAEKRWGRRTLADCSGRTEIPRRGVYFFFEPGELRADGVTPRVVRVGTHGLRPSKSTLGGRLRQHRGHDGGSFAGGGNHRGSVFRRHAGKALALRDNWTVVGQWDQSSSVAREVRLLEHALERAISEYLRAMDVIWVAVDDEPSAASHRGVIECGSIALLSNFTDPGPDLPSAAWLGAHSDRETIRRSGLWNVNHVAEAYDPRFLAVLEHHVTT